MAKNYYAITIENEIIMFSCKKARDKWVDQKPLKRGNISAKHAYKLIKKGAPLSPII